MTRLHLEIDGRPVDVASGSTILQAARALGVEVPTLCYHDELEPKPSCLLCLVRVRGDRHLVPACSTPVTAGMVVESECDDVRDARKLAIELLLSDHVGDCVSVCRRRCPAQMDIPGMIRSVDAGDAAAAIRVIKESVALPAVMGYACHAPCEAACRGSSVDEGVAIQKMERWAAEEDLAGSPMRPTCAASSGQRVAIVGAGPAGLAAAFYLRIAGHDCVVYDARAEAGGMLRYELGEDRLPRRILDREIAGIADLGVRFELGIRVAEDPCLEDLRAQFDAVVLACGPCSPETLAAWGLPTTPHGVKIESGTFKTALAGVFAAGDIVRARRQASVSVGAGRFAAVAVDQLLRGEDVVGEATAFTSTMSGLSEDELAALGVVDGAPRADHGESTKAATGSALAAEAADAASQCLRCNCASADICGLRRYAGEYGAVQKRFSGARRRFERQYHDNGLVFEPGKCIACGLCVRLTEREGEALGLTQVGRGFDVRIGGALESSIAEAVARVGEQCARICPTGALTINLDPAVGEPRMDTNEHE